MWDLIKKINQASRKGDINLSLNYNGKLISEPTHVPNLFNTYFMKIAERLECNFIPVALKYTNCIQK
jgi:hypothetical protein